MDHSIKKNKATMNTTTTTTTTTKSKKRSLDERIDIINKHVGPLYLELAKAELEWATSENERVSKCIKLNKEVVFLTCFFIF